MQGFKSPNSAQRFYTTHTAIYNVLAYQRHLICRRSQLIFRAEGWIGCGRLRSPEEGITGYVRLHETS